LPDGTARTFSVVMDAKAIMPAPAYAAALTERGWWEIRGLAWSGRGRVTRVDVSTDAGKTWVPAELQEPVLPKCHTRFRLPWNWDGRDAMLMSRAVDETGYVQPPSPSSVKCAAPALRTTSTTFGPGGCAATAPCAGGWRGDVARRSDRRRRGRARHRVRERQAGRAPFGSPGAVRVGPCRDGRRDQGVGHRRDAGR